MAEKNPRAELFERMPIPKAVATLAVPTMISSLVMVIYSMADTWFVGLLNDPVQNAAVTLAGPVLLAFNAINNLFGVGTSSMMSRALGAKDYDLVRESSAFGFYSALFFGVMISVFCSIFFTPLLGLLGVTDTTREVTTGYMFWTVCLGAAPSILNVVFANLVRSEGAALHASIGMMSGCVLNMILDPVFILLFGMGAVGAGLATFLSNCFACGYFFVLMAIKRGKTFVCIDPRRFSLKRHIVLGVFIVGIPAAIQNLLNVTGMTILNNLTAGYGADAVAAMGIAQKVNTLPFYIIFGASQGIMPMISYNYTAGNPKRMKDTIGFFIKLALPLAVALSAFLWVGSGVVIRAFIEDSAVIAYGAAFLKGFALATPFVVVDFLAVGVFQALGLGQYSLVFAILRKIVLEIPAIMILNQLFPLYGMAYAQFCAEVILGIAGAVMVIRIVRKAMKEMAARREV